MAMKLRNGWVGARLREGLAATRDIHLVYTQNAFRSCGQVIELSSTFEFWTAGRQSRGPISSGLFRPGEETRIGKEGQTMHNASNIVLCPYYAMRGGRRCLTGDD